MKEAGKTMRRGAHGLLGGISVDLYANLIQNLI